MDTDGQRGIPGMWVGAVGGRTTVSTRIPRDRFRPSPARDTTEDTMTTAPDGPAPTRPGLPPAGTARVPT